MILPNNKAWREETALGRYQIIAPLLDESLDTAKRSQMRKQISDQSGQSIRTLYRYEKAYRNGGFSALFPADRTGNQSSRLPDNYPELLNEAIQLKREVPSRSVEQIILILEMEGRAEPGTLKRSTLQRHLYNAGFGRRQMKVYNEARQSSSRRFCKPHRMMLAQADIKYGPTLPIGKNGKGVKTYLSAVIDDHSRLILDSGFYVGQEQEIVEDTLRRAILKHGKMDAAYFDNGRQYISKQLKIALSKLGIRIIHCKPYSPASKGKIEIYNRFVNAFLAEAKADRVRTLDALNQRWQLWVEAYYHNKPHSGIQEYYESLGVSVPESGITPLQEFNRDSRRLVFLDASTVGEAFLHHEKRRVDKGGCIRFRGRLYEASSALIGATVEISYDPMKTETLTVRYKDVPAFEILPVEIKEFCAPKPQLPTSMQAVEPECSRFLKGLEQQYARQKERQANAISFGAYRKDGAGNV